MNHWVGSNENARLSIPLEDLLSAEKKGSICKAQLKCRLLCRT